MGNACSTVAVQGAGHPAPLAVLPVRSQPWPCTFEGMHLHSNQFREGSMMAFQAPLIHQRDTTRSARSNPPDVQACAAQRATPLNARHFQAQLSRLDGCDVATRPTTDDDHILGGLRGRRRTGGGRLVVGLAAQPTLACRRRVQGQRCGIARGILPSTARADKRRPSCKSPTRPGRAAVPHHAPPPRIAPHGLTWSEAPAAAANVRAPSPLMPPASRPRPKQRSSMAALV